MPDVPGSSPKENLRASQSNTYLSPGSLFNPRHKRNRSIFYADEILARHSSEETPFLRERRTWAAKDARGSLRMLTECLCFARQKRLLASFLKQYPSIELQLKEECATALLDCLRAETVDLAIMPLPVSIEGMSATELMKERLFAIVNKDHPFKKETK
jgi:DNA-binding transcriptional LysR family regulator